MQCTIQQIFFDKKKLSCKHLVWKDPTVPISSAGLGWVKGKRVSSFSREESFNSDVGVAVALPPAGRLSWTWWQPHGGDGGGGGGAAPNGGSL
jgi:hypothetical protein